MYTAKYITQEKFMKPITFASLVALLFVSFFITVHSNVQGDQEWTLAAKISYTHNVNAAGFIDDKHGITVGYGGECRYTLDGGSEWLKAANHSACRYTLDYIDTNTILNAGNSRQVRISSDGGKSWQEIPECGVIGRFISFIDGKKGWIASDMKIVSTKDAGTTWNTIKSPEMIIMAITVLPDDSAFVLDDEANLYVSTFEGKKWIKKAVNSAKGLTFPSLRFFDANNGIIVGYDKDKKQLVSLETENGGKKWSRKIVGDIAGKTYIAPDGKTLTVMCLDNQILVYRR
jgi:photosystem II stability/assembly factor-like uncharacterized protein